MLNLPNFQETLLEVHYKMKNLSSKQAAVKAQSVINYRLNQVKIEEEKKKKAAERRKNKRLKL